MKSNAALKTEIAYVKSITEELYEIKEMNNGLLNPAIVVEYARNKETALHKKFLWDDSKAAENWRIWQARQIIRLELVVIRPAKRSKITFIANIKRENDDKKVRAFVSLPLDRRAEENSGYRDVAEVMGNKELREQLLESAKKDMTTFRRKYWMLDKLAKVFEAMATV